MGMGGRCLFRGKECKSTLLLLKSWGRGEGERKGGRIMNLSPHYLLPLSPTIHHPIYPPPPLHHRIPLLPPTLLPYYPLPPHSLTSPLPPPPLLPPSPSPTNLHLQPPKTEYLLTHTHSRPGILVLINDADWELEGGEAYLLQPGDNILFVSTLHGG